MKKVFLVASILFLSLAGFAQKGFHIGAAYEFNSTFIVNQNAWNINSPTIDVVGATPDQEPELEYRAAFGSLFGVGFGYNFTNNLGFHTELSISHQGQKYEGYYLETILEERKVTMQYFQIPIFFKFTSSSPNARFSIMAGPQFGFLTKANATLTRGVEGPHHFNDPYTGQAEVYDNLDVKDRFQPSDFGIAVHVGADIPLTDHLYISAGLRIYWGFSDINAEAWRFHKDLYPYDYHKSNNAYGGPQVGLHYIIGQGFSD